MRKIIFTSKYKKDFKRELKTYGQGLNDLVTAVVSALAKDEPLDSKYKDHALIGNYVGARDCHIKPNLVLIYEKHGDTDLFLVRLGSHVELGLR